METVIFDLDCTLADTSGDLLAAANACFQQMGEGDVLTQADAGVALRGGKFMLRAGLERLGRPDEAVVEAFYPVLLEAYAADLDRRTVFYDGALDAVEALKLDGFGVGICTNKPEALAVELMRRLGALYRFASLVGCLLYTSPSPRD